jgi:type IX secretion system PorP/SprF family membrane protein
MSIFKKIVLFICTLIVTVDLSAQQDPQYSQYMFNQLALNPAYAGSKEALSTAVFLRSQWTGIEGAPQTETLTLHGPLKKKKVGLGLTIIADQIGPKNSIGVLGSYAYRIPIRNGKLAFGLRAGVYSFTYNWNNISHKDQSDVVYLNNPNSKIVPTADAGIYYYTNTLYVGFSATHLYNGRLTSVSSQNGDDSQFSPHYFFTFGKAWSLSEKVIFNPSIMVKAANNSPGAVDINASFLLNQKIWLGASARSGYGVVVFTQIYLTDKFRFGYAFDFGFNKIGRAGGGTHEIMLGYDFNIYKSKMTSPRYL